MERMQSTKYLYPILVLSGLILFLVTHSQMSLEPDSYGYLEISKSMRDGLYWHVTTSNSKHNEIGAIRTPAYPLLLAIVQLASNNPLDAAFLLHAFLGLCAMAALLPIFYMRFKTNPWPVFVSLLISFYFVGSSFQAVLCEWPGFVGLLILFGLTAQTARFPDLKIYRIGTALVCAALILLKPVFLAGTIPALIYQLMILKNSAITRSIFISFFLLPLLVWMSFNHARLGSFTIAPFGSFNLFGVASLIGHAETQAGDAPLLRDFIQKVNDSKIPAYGSEQSWIEELPEHGDLELYDYNMWRIAAPFRTDNSLSWVEMNMIAGVYATRAITSFPTNYFRYILFSLYESSYTILIALIVLLVSLIRSSSPDYFSIVHSVRLTAVIHLTLVLATCLGHGALNRYWLMSEGSVLFAALTVLYFAWPTSENIR
jgi:hypothetical protein